MKANDRARLTAALRDHVAKIAADLRARVRAPGAVRTAAEQLHKDERVAEDFEVWTDLLSRRAAVLWVLKSVYVRVLEDRGLLAPGRLLDPEAQQLFEKLAPNLGETAFLRWIFKDLASAKGGVPELFSPQPAEVAVPSDDLSRALIAFWRHRDADTGAVWSFAEERFEGELMGDLYQELDPVVKDRFALCQTPDFVRAFILDRTLTPAIEAFGADDVRLLDPACGSGHFLIDGLKRLVAATAEKHADWDRAKVVAHALDRVVGVDLNDYACALARTRLIMTAAELAGVTKLADAARFHPHVYWADGLEQVEREEQKAMVQTDLFTKIEEKPRATLTRSDVRAALKKVFATKFHAVVANPPYIVESDDARKDYHREKLGKKQRYVSAYRQYSLGSPFAERCFQLAVGDGFVGMITGNNFMKREFGKPLIESVLARLDLTLIVDTSHAFIPFHATPTVLLFGRNRRPVDAAVRTVMGKRGESGTPEDPENAEVWQSIAKGWRQVGFDDEYVTVANLPRETLAKHPWSLGGGGAAELKERLEAAAGQRLKDHCKEIGRTNVCGEDPVYIMSPGAAARLGAGGLERPLTIGEVVRDWTIAPREFVLYPYQSMGGESIPESHPSVSRYFWKYRTLLKARSVFGKSTEQRGGTWFEHLEHYADRLRTPLSISFAEVATHNHFVLDRGGRVFKQTAPVIKLEVGAGEEAHLALLGVLNSSTSCFWMKQVFYPKASKTHDIDKAGTLPENNRFAFDATKMRLLPIPSSLGGSRLAGMARRVDELAKERDAALPARVLENPGALQSARALRSALSAAEAREQDAFMRMVFWQEEIDWETYVLFGLVGREALSELKETPVPAEARPFVWDGASELVPVSLRAEYARRRELIAKSPELRLIETPVHKRPWRGTQGVFGRYDRTYDDKSRTALSAWLTEQIERAAKPRTTMFSIEQLAAEMQDDSQILAVCEILTGRKDFSLSQLVADALQSEAVPSHRFHLYKPSGLVKREVWERTWADQGRQDAGEKVEPTVPPPYGSGDFLRPEYYQLRGKLDVPTERFIAFTEVPGRTGIETLYGWAGWTAQQRVKAILAIDEELEDASVPLADRIGLLDSAWRMLHDVAREDAAVATRLKAELQALVGPEGPSHELIEGWKKRFPPPTMRAPRPRKAAVARDNEDSEESDES